MPQEKELFTFQKAGEYRVDYNVSYKDANEVLWMGSRSWGNVVESPDSLIVTHGRRGSESNAETDNGIIWKILIVIRTHTFSYRIRPETYLGWTIPLLGMRQ